MSSSILYLYYVFFVTGGGVNVSLLCTTVQLYWTVHLCLCWPTFVHLVMFLVSVLVVLMMVMTVLVVEIVDLDLVVVLDLAVVV